MPTITSPDHINLAGLTQYDGATSFFGGVAPLSQAFGYGSILGWGAVFAVMTLTIMWIDHKYGGTPDSSEEYNTAGRSIKTGLIAVDIVSHWTWAATLLQSSNQAFQHGVSGPFWYAAGATIQIILFGILAIEVKRKAPSAHTILEIIRARWGTEAHLVFFFFCILTNIIVTSMLLLGGCDAIAALTGMSVYAAAFLIPMTVLVYVATGGLKATFVSSYVHTVLIYVALCIFVFKVYGSSEPVLGSPSKVWALLVKQSEANPVADNMGGSYLTMFSKGGFIFGIINIIGNFGTVFVDQAYWQSAIAATPSAANRGYILGGLLWFCIPFTLATCLGLACLALDLPITVTEANEGLVPPAAALYLLGNGGGFLIITMLIMAVTSSGSAEMVAVSSLFTFDGYKTYINPRASPKQILRVSQGIVVLYACLMGVMAIILLKLNVSLGYVYELMGVLIGSAVVPIAMCLTWKKANKWGAICGAFGGLALGLMSWLVYAAVGYGAININTTFEDYVMLTGNVVSLCMSGIIVTVWSLIWPENYDFVSMKEIQTIDDGDTNELGFTKAGRDSPEAMDAAFKWVCKWGGLLALVLIVLWPLLALPARVFSEGYFTFWVILSIIWGLVAAGLAIFWPLVEARHTIIKLSMAPFRGSAPVKQELDSPKKSVEMPPKDDDTANKNKFMV